MDLELQYILTRENTEDFEFEQESVPLIIQNRYIYTYIYFVYFWMNVIYL